MRFEELSYYNVAMRETLFFCVAVIALALPLTGEDFLPTPYTAEQIRDAWQVGLEVTTRVRTAKGESYSRTEVLEWTAEGFRMSDRAVSRAGIPTDEEGSYYSGTWVELRDHAKFPAATTTRERAERDTTLGKLEGWLYQVSGKDGESEFFFADGLPGPPVVYRKSEQDTGNFLAEQISRSP